MSGEAIAIASLASTPAGMAVLGGIAGAIAVGAALDQINAYRDNQKKLALQAMRKRKHLIKEWQSFQEQQQQQMQNMESAQTLVLDKIARLTLLQTNPANTTDTSVKSRGFIPQANDYIHEIESLDELIAFCDSLPDILLEENSPIKRLKQQTTDLKARYKSTSPPLIETLNSLQKTVQLTIEQQLSTLEQQQKNNQKLVSQSESLLNQVIEYQSYNPEPQQSRELKAIEQHLLKIMQQQAVTFSDLDLLENKFAQIKQTIDMLLEQEAIHHSVSESMQVHLMDMGYEQVIDKNSAAHSTALASGKGESTWIIPGGEQVRIALHKDHRIAFQLQHERAFEQKGQESKNNQTIEELDGSELAFFRQQEQKWCTDLKELVNRLVADGFQYQVNFEREMPEESIPIVVIDDLNDLIDEDYNKKQTQDKKQQRHLK